MPQSLASVHVHTVYSTKDRKPILLPELKEELHAFQGAALVRLGCHPILINSVEDHIHSLFTLSRTASISEVLEEIKKSSSRWLKTKTPELSTFSWQAGYGAFGVGRSELDTVTHYIAHQEDHHRKVDFKTELRELMRLHNVAFDERYLWD